jgi:hypothetical protein
MKGFLSGWLKGKMLSSGKIARRRPGPSHEKNCQSDTALGGNSLFHFSTLEFYEPVAG